jgi:hypothetical protein
MPAYARLKGETHIFPDAAKVHYMGQSGTPVVAVLLMKQNDQEIAYIRLGEGDFVTVGDEPQFKPDA